MDKQIKCPSCRKPAAWKENPYRPFCSEACKSRDLGNWAMEKYRIPDEEKNEPENAPGGRPGLEE